MDYIVLSIPIFFILIGVELIVSKLRNSELYRFNDAVTNISCGILQQITGVFAKTILIVGYLYLYENYRLLEIEDSFITYLLLFIGIDFCYYWFHRLAHEISLFWGTHIVHHQSEDYNFSVALRQSSLQGFVSMIFYLPLALIGFNPIAFVTINAFQTLYQFWIHTKTIDKLPAWIEFIFNTPSHHRVHHGRNPKYIDKNHGGTLIIFDRLFGTFQAEEEEVIYGVTKPLASWNPLWANFDWYADMWKDLRQSMSWSDRIRLLFNKPGWMPEHLGGYRAPKSVDDDHWSVYQTKIPTSLNYYILFQYLLVLGFTSYFLFQIEDFNRFNQVVIALFIVISITVLGGIFELRRWSFVLEIVRWLVVIVVIIFSDFLIPLEPKIIVGTLAIFSVIWISRFAGAFKSSPQLSV